VQDRDAIGEPEDHVHVVLDDEERQRSVETGDERRDPLGLRGRHPGGRLVEQQHFGSAHEGERELELPPLPVR